jgi:aspartyl-tRNA(Asn)/glutamyl-tRNA(Gln) amidotransferase subunit A
MTLVEQAHALSGHWTTSRALVDDALDKIVVDSRPYYEVFSERARAEADASDRARRLGQPMRALEGLPISVKDLFDIAGQPTPAGTPILKAGPIARADAPIVARLRAAGAVILGRTHMSPFAFSGVGLNPYGRQPVNPRDPARAPGGSSSGAGVTVGLGQVAASIGTDTGGSVRIPAALCGVVGFKPTKARITCEGAVPLSPSLDSVGPLATTVEDCRLLDAVLADTPPEAHPPLTLAGLRFATVADFVLDEIEPEVAADFERALARLSAAGAVVEPVAFPALKRIPEIEANGGVINAEAFAVHARAGWTAKKDLYDPNVWFRLEAGGRMSSTDYLNALWGWRDLAAQADALFEDYDAVLWPTCPICAPVIADLADPKAFGRANSLLLRNTRIINLMDRCAISLPMSEPGALPTGLMLSGPRMGDARLLAVAAAVEAEVGKRG